MSTQLGTVKQTSHANRTAENAFGKTLKGLDTGDFNELISSHDSLDKAMFNRKQSALLKELENDFSSSVLNDASVSHDTENSDQVGLDIGDLPVSIREQVKQETQKQQEASDGIELDDEAKPKSELEHDENLTPEEIKKREEAERNAQNKPNQAMNQKSGGFTIPPLGLGKRKNGGGNSLGNPLSKDRPAAKELTAKPVTNAVLSNNAQANSFTKTLRQKTAMHEFALSRLNDRLNASGMSLNELSAAFESVNGARQINQKPPARDLETVNKALNDRKLMKAFNQHEAALNDLTTHLSPSRLEGIKQMADKGLIGNSALNNLQSTTETAVKSASKGVETASVKHAGKSSGPETGNLEKMQKLLEGFSSKLNIDLSGMMKSVSSMFNRNS